MLDILPSRELFPYFWPRNLVDISPLNYDEANFLLLYTPCSSKQSDAKT